MSNTFILEAVNAKIDSFSAYVARKQQFTDDHKKDVKNFLKYLRSLKIIGEFKI